MRRLLLLTILLICLAALCPALRVAAQSGDPAGVEISAPTTGAPLQGLVPILGSAAGPGFRSWELTFSYASDATGTWFLIAEGSEPISGGELAQWDTTTITDGQYHLRLTVFFEGGQRQHFLVNDLRVRNYTPIETITPTPTITSTPFTETPQPTLSPTATPIPTETSIPPTQTPLPTNPVEITRGDLDASLLRGASGALAAFALVGLYVSVKRIFRK